jgi:2'-hydroxyisoflavone reductase
MPATRREFLQHAVGAGGAFALAAGALAHTNGADPMLDWLDAVEPADKKLDVLILGGTGFIGPHQVRYAQARGHKVTIFNRGRTRPDLFPNVEALRGDRDPEVNEGLTALEGRKFDVVIDNSGYIPRLARASAELLKDNVSRYLFISTISVYAANDTPNADESAAVGTLDDPTVEEVTGVSYGPLKAYCEQAVQEVYGDRATIVRPGLIVGPGDPTDRFTYWPIRVDRGGEILAPGDGTTLTQFIDARDLVAFTIHLLENDTGGVYNATGPESHLSMAEFLYGLRAVTTGNIQFTWASADFLAEQQVAPWGQMPCWIPDEGEYAGFGSRDISAAVAQGMTFRPLAETARDTIHWWKSLPEDRTATMRAGLTPEREAEVLAAWHESQAG